MTSQVVRHAVRDRSPEGEHESFQMVCFHVGQETFGMAIDNLREVIRVGAITQVPESPAYVLGLINLRNHVIPVVDMATRLGVPAGTTPDQRRIMILRVGKRTMGVIVDHVDQIYRIDADSIVPAPASVSILEDVYLRGLVELDGRLIVLVRLEKLLGDSVGFFC